MTSQSSYLSSPSFQCQLLKLPLKKGERKMCTLKAKKENNQQYKTPTCLSKAGHSALSIFGLRAFPFQYSSTLATTNYRQWLE